MVAGGMADLTLVLVLSLSKDEAAARAMNASSFGKLRMSRTPAFAPEVLSR